MSLGGQICHDLRNRISAEVGASACIRIAFESNPLQVDGQIEILDEHKTGQKGKSRQHEGRSSTGGLYSICYKSVECGCRVLLTPGRGSAYVSACLKWWGHIRSTKRSTPGFGLTGARWRRGRSTDTL